MESALFLRSTKAELDKVDKMHFKSNFTFIVKLTLHSIKAT